MKKLFMILSVFLSLALVAAACGSDDDTSATGSESSGGGEGLGDGSLGTVTVEAGEAIQIRSLEAISGEVAFLGLPNQRATAAAIADYGQIQGFDVDMGAGLDDLCSADGGQAAAQNIVADEQVVGVIGTSCSGAATAAAPLISEAGMVMVSASNTCLLYTSPSPRDATLSRMPSSA